MNITTVMTYYQYSSKNNERASLGRSIQTVHEVRSLMGWGMLGTQVHIAYFGDTWGIDTGFSKYSVWSQKRTFL